MTRLTVEQIKQQIAEDAKRIREKIQPEIEAAWQEIEARQADEAAETAAMVEVHRERRESAEARQRREGQPVPLTGDTTEEVTPMAVSAPEKKSAVTPFPKAQQVGKKKAAATKALAHTLAKAQAGAKKGSANQRVKAAAKAGTPKAVKNGEVGKYDADAKKHGVRIKPWNKGSQADPKHATVVFTIYVEGSRHRALPDTDTLAEALKLCKENGYPVKAKPEAAKK